ncbi:MAG: lipopolysaccharide biosynthesis protein [Desulfobaccales bacterium]
MNLARRGLSVFITNWIFFPLQLLSGVVVVRSIGAEGQGIFVIVTAAAGMLAMVGQLGMPAGSIYYLKSGKYNERTIIANNLPAILLASLLLTVLAVVGRDWFTTLFLHDGPVDSSLLLLIFLSLPVIMLNGFISMVVLAKGETREYALLTVGGAIANLALTVIFLLLLKWGLKGAFAAWFSAQVLMTFWRFGTILRRSRGQNWELSFKIMWTLLRFGSQQYLGTFGSQLFKRSDQFLLAYFLNPAAVGYYSVAMMAYETLLSIPRAMNTLLAGEVSALEGPAAATLTAQAGRYLLLLMVGAGALGAVLSHWAVPFLYGANFAQAVPPLLILILAALFMGSTFNLNAYFLGVGHPALNGIFPTLGGLLNLALSLWLIPAAGIMGKALATLLSSVFTYFLHLVWFMRLSGLPARSCVVFAPQDVEKCYFELNSWYKRVKTILIGHSP